MMVDMNEMAAFSHESVSGGDVVRFTGSLSLARIGDLPERLRGYDGQVAVVDLSGIDRIDTIGAWIVHRFAAQHGARIEGLNKDSEHLLHQVEAADQPVAMRPPQDSGLTRVVGEIGDAVVISVKTLYGLLGFLGATVIAFGSVIRYRRFRFNATVQRFEVVGVTALGIIGLMSFLIGIVIGQQGAVQLRQFGAEVFTINLIGRITLRDWSVGRLWVAA